MPDAALFELWPGLRSAFAHVSLGEWPTRVEPFRAGPGQEGWLKRDDRSAARYGGNKVRTLEFLLADMAECGHTHVWSTGAFGSNHALATALHAPRVGLVPGALLFPQPGSPSAVENLRATLSAGTRVRVMPHWAALPTAAAQLSLTERARGLRSVVMAPGGATPLGAVGYVSAALELALQVDAGELPRPTQVVVGVGSTCTSAGLLLGFHLAAALGIGWHRAPRLVAVRVTPWPVTSARRIVSLALRCEHLLSRVAPWMAPASRKQLLARLEVDGKHLGRGYGIASSTGTAAAETFTKQGGPRVDSTYGAKSAAAFLEWLGRGSGPTLYWATKSTVALPADEPTAIARAPRRMKRWLAESDR